MYSCSSGMERRMKSEKFFLIPNHPIIIIIIIIVHANIYCTFCKHVTKFSNMY